MPSPPHLAEAEVADAESFLADMLIIFPTLAIQVFEGPPRSREGEHVLTVRGRGVQAKGYETRQGFVVLAQSQAVAQEVPSIHRYMSVLRRELLAQGVLEQGAEHLEFTQDHVFSAPSTAAGVVLGRPANGRIEWKDSQGRTLGEARSRAPSEPAGDGRRRRGELGRVGSRAVGRSWVRTSLGRVRRIRAALR